MDLLSQALPQAGPYISFWNPDFLAESLRRKGTVLRYYPEKHLAVDIGRPKSHLSQKKSQLLSLRGIKYLCLPKNSAGQLLNSLHLPIAAKRIRFPRLSPL